VVRAGRQGAAIAAMPGSYDSVMGTLRGFPNPPAMVRAGQSPAAPHAEDRLAGAQVSWRVLTFRPLPPHSSILRLAIVFLLLLGTKTACDRKGGGPKSAPSVALEAALSPERLVTALKKARGGHVHAVTAFAIDDETVATTTDLWMDPKGQFRLVETNDRDGGREVVHHGSDYYIGLRHSKMTRRQARDPEPEWTLGEALGGPWAAWEVLRGRVKVTAREETRDGQTTVLYEIERDDSAPPPSDEEAEEEGDGESAGDQNVSDEPGEDGTTPARARKGAAKALRKWRETIVLQKANGAVRIAKRSGMLLGARLEAEFTARRGDRRLVGRIRVEANTQKLGAVAAVKAPKAEELKPRQRTILEERALLPDLGSK